MPDFPTIAVIIPAYNREHMLSRALDSVLAQSLPPSEICVVDDGSTDNSAAMLSAHYPTVSYIYQPNAGVSAARNLGAQHTKGEWLAFLDSDDEWTPRKLELQLEALNSNREFRVAHCDEIWMRKGVRVNPGEKYRKAGGDIFESCLSLCAMAPSAVVMERSLFLELGGFDPHFPACEDYDLWLRLCSRFPVLYVDKSLVIRHGGHADQLSAKHWGMDRFRVQALAKLLDAECLNESQDQAARSMLITKCRILKAGAEKRKNVDMQQYCNSMLENYAASQLDITLG